MGEVSQSLRQTAVELIIHKSSGTTVVKTQKQGRSTKSQVNSTQGNKLKKRTVVTKQGTNWQLKQGYVQTRGRS